MKFRQQKTLQKGGYKGYKVLFYTDLSNNKEQKTLQRRDNQTTNKILITENTPREENQQQTKPSFSLS